MTGQKRIYGIDSLRAVAMLLGIVLHASIAYKAKPHRNWIFDEEYHSVGFSLLYFIIHSFRMPVFFIVAGFFCRLLYHRIGEKEFLLHRLKRILIPFGIGVFLIVPISLIPFNLYLFVYKQGIDWSKAFTLSFFKLFNFNGLAHLWFLYDLLIFYAVTILLLRLKKFKVFTLVMVRVNYWWQKVRVNIFHWLFLVVLPLWLFMLSNVELYPVADGHLIPQRFNNLAYYGYAFFIGWMLHKRPDMLELAEKKYHWFLWPGLLATAIGFYLEWNSFWNSYYLFLGAKLFAAIQVSLMIVGCIGFFLRHFNKDSRFWRYVSDASYWVYLTHLFFVALLQLLFLNSGVPGEARFSLVIFITLLATFLSYHYFVRFTFIGSLLHGKRYKRNPVKKTIKC